MIQLGGLLPDPDPFSTKQEATWTATASPGELVLVVRSVSVASDGPQAPPDLAPLVGLKGTLAVDERGAVSGAAWVFPPGLDEQQTRRAEGLQSNLAAVVPLPDEAVGVGARWRVVEVADASGIALEVVRTYKLIERRGDELVLDLSLSVEAPPAFVSLPAFEGRVEELRFAGSQRLELDLTKPMPTRSGSSTLHLVVKGRKAMVPLSMVLDVDQRLVVHCAFRWRAVRGCAGLRDG